MQHSPEAIATKGGSFSDFASTTLPALDPVQVDDEMRTGNSARQSWLRIYLEEES